MFQRDQPHKNQGNQHGLTFFNLSYYCMRIGNVVPRELEADS